MAFFPEMVLDVEDQSEPHGIQKRCLFSVGYTGYAEWMTNIYPSLLTLKSECLSSTLTRLGLLGVIPFTKDLQSPMLLIMCCSDQCFRRSACSRVQGPYRMQRVWVQTALVLRVRPKSWITVCRYCPVSLIQDTSRKRITIQNREEI